MTDLDILWTIQAIVDILNVADRAHRDYINEVWAARALTDAEWDNLHQTWERVHVPALYAYDPRRAAVSTSP